MPTNQQANSKVNPLRQGPWWLLVAMIVSVSTPVFGQSSRVVITAQPGYSIMWDGNNGGYSNPEAGAAAPENLALASKGVTPFGSSELDFGVHFIININDGFYGNSSSWIPKFTDPPDTAPFIGLGFGKTVNVGSIAWGRDNGDNTEPGCGGPCTDRAVGVYTLQVTTVANPGMDTAETGDSATGWATIGTVEYKPESDNRFFSAYLRHRFDVAASENPIPATGLRVKVSSNQMAIDEIEVNPGPDPVPPLANFLVLTPEAGYNIQWDGNDGLLFDANAPARAPKNAASGATAFGSSEFGGGVHFTVNVIDGLYGNSHSWMPNFTAPDPNPFIGLSFPAAVQLKSIAWGRDNGDNVEGPCVGGQCTDRALGNYVLQVTRAANPGASTPETGDPATGWATIATVQYKGQGTPFTPYLRHRFDVAMADGSAIAATGLRIKVPDSNTAIDEIEINVNAGQEQNLVVINSEPGYSISWDGNDGDFYNPQAGARAPNNDALAASGAAAFGSSELGFGVHFFPKVNDGFYGNSSSWISANGLGGSTDPDPFVGVKFGKTVSISSIAWGRDNGDTTEGGCGGTCLDRWQGIYTLQVTTVANPGVDTQETGDAATGWLTVGTVQYVGTAPPSFNASRRHRFDAAADGKPIPATGLRLKVSDGNIAIDEIEINPVGVVVAPPITDLIAITSSPGYSVNWNGNDGEYQNASATAPAPENLALASKGATAFGGSQLDFGVHFIANVNDGLYGNKHSWIADFTKPDPDPFIGVKFAKPVAIRSVAWGRDNGDNTEGPANPNTDRALGTYTLQITRADNPGADTPETGDPATGWTTVGVFQYKGAFATLFNPHLRHRFRVVQEGLPVVLATGLRIKVSDPNLAIDEVEVNPLATPDENILVITPEAGYAITWDGNDGDFSSPAADASAPNNAALAKNGSTAFGSSQLDFGVHFIANINDGLYGNKHSWMADFAAAPDPDPWIGVRFGKTVMIENVAWGRDNGDNTEGPANPNTDRAAGLSTLQVTTVASPATDTEETGDPSTGWATIGTILYRGAGSAALHHYLRHNYGVSLDGKPIPATAFRLKVSSNQIAIDEIEVNTEIPLPKPPVVLSMSRQAAGLTISWTGTGTLEEANEVTGPWATVAGATSPYLTQPTAERKFYRVKE